MSNEHASSTFPGVGPSRDCTKDEASAAALLGTTIGPWTLERVLGQGSVGVVYLARHAQLASAVAIKILRAELSHIPPQVKQFEDEARAVSAVTHLHLVPVIDAGRLADERPYVIMQHAAGVPLDTFIAKAGIVRVVDARAIVEQLASALLASHARGVVHRDLKPANVIIERVHDGTPFVRLVDFGLAITPSATRQKDASHAFIGTPLYCAPEQARGEVAGPPADIYALGALAYELLSGRPPLTGSTDEVLAEKSIRDPDPLSRLDVPAALAALVAAMLAREPARRPAAGDVLAALAQIATAASAADDALALALAPPRSRHLMPVLIATGSLGACGLVVALVMAFSSGANRESTTKTSSAIAAPPPQVAPLAPIEPPAPIAPPLVSPVPATPEAELPIPIASIASGGSGVASTATARSAVMPAPKAVAPPAPRKTTLIDPFH